MYHVFRPTKWVNVVSRINKWMVTQQTHHNLFIYISNRTWQNECLLNDNSQPISMLFKYILLFFSLSTCAAHLSLVLFGSLSWWLKIWMILCLHKIFYCRRPTSLHFWLQENVLTKQNSYGMVTCYGNWTVKYSLTTNWIRAFIEMGSPVRKYGNRQYTQVSFFPFFSRKSLHKFSFMQIRIVQW